MNAAHRAGEEVRVVGRAQRLDRVAEARQVDAVDAVLVGQRRDGGEEGRLGAAEPVEHHHGLGLRVAGARDRDVAHRRAHAGEHEPAGLARSRSWRRGSRRRGGGRRGSAAARRGTRSSRRAGPAPTRAQVARSADSRASGRSLRSAASSRFEPRRITKSHSPASSTRSRSRARPVGASNAEPSKRPTSASRTGGVAAIAPSYPIAAYPQRSPMSDLENRTRYEPSEAEPRVFERWEASGRFHPEPTGSPEDNYSIAIPPPNVTGALHMGHALNGSIQDALIRHARMQGRNTKWILGTDHAGIATQTQVERALKAQGTSKEELGREEFLERMWEWRHQYGGTIISQYRRLGASCRLRRGALHARRPLRPRGPEGLRRPLRQGPDLPRQLHGQLGPGLALGDLRPRGRGARGHRHALLRRLPARGLRRARSRSPPCGRRRCSPTPRSRSIPTTSATRGWWGRRRSCRSSGGG